MNMSFIGQSAPDIRRKLQHLDGALGTKPSQMVDIVFKVYNAQEARKLEQAMVLLEQFGETGRRDGT